jgi:hypothetical protein
MRHGGKAGDQSTRTTDLRSGAWTRKAGILTNAMRFRVPWGSRSIRRLVYHANIDLACQRDYFVSTRISSPLAFMQSRTIASSMFDVRSRLSAT